MVARFLRSRRIEHIDVAVVSHPHPDHYLGLLAVGAALPIAELWSAAEPAPDPVSDSDPVSDPDPDPDPDPGPWAPWMDESIARADSRRGAGFASVAAWLGDRGTRWRHPILGTHVHGDVTIRVLVPRYELAADPLLATADPVRTVNDNSLVIALARAGRCVLFAGDVEVEGEAALIAAAGGALPCDVVKVPHHGSPTSSSPALVAATRPALAVISLGRGNRFGFPGPSVVERWRAAGARVLRTDQVGAVTVTIDRAGHLTVTTVDAPADADSPPVGPILAPPRS